MLMESLGSLTYLFSRKTGRMMFLLSALVMSAVLLSCAIPENAEAVGANKGVSDAVRVDAFMGDWRGGWTLNDGSDSGPLATQVIALGKGEYQANILDEFDTRSRPIAVLTGRLEDSQVKFAGEGTYNGTDFAVRATIADGKFTGKFDGSDAAGTLTMERVVRPSPTLGAKAPAGAVVLFDGRNFDQWERLGTFAGIINIAKVIGGADNSSAYMRAEVFSNAEREAILQLGSDDGIKAWLNGDVVHANNASRAASPGQDKVKVNLKQGWNELMLKITNGGADWAACARLVGADGNKLADLGERDARSSQPTRRYLDQNDDYLTVWEISGPYAREGKDGPSLLDVAFAPERRGAAEPASWKRTGGGRTDPKKVQWRLVDGAMEVTAGTGSIVTKKKFKDFKMHVEFRTPFMPDARGQGRGNSGVYLRGRYEVQVLDSYGLEGRDNECGGIYQVGSPIVNMCAPPMQWQTYDITFRGPRFDADGKKTAEAAATIIHNGVMIHDKRVLPNPTGGALDSNTAEPGGIYLQDHGNPVQYRNIWLVELP